MYNKTFYIINKPKILLEEKDYTEMNITMYLHGTHNVH